MVLPPELAPPCNPELLVVLEAPPGLLERGAADGDDGGGEPPAFGFPDGLEPSAALLSLPPLLLVLRPLLPQLAGAEAGWDARPGRMRCSHTRSITRLRLPLPGSRLRAGKGEK